ncbi:hypothetical protein [Streptomyces sp. NPDC101234]|uniref:hypothetical protein n=1 Tax=Streptomyces sp. NPDC101234 TaxID=3366138 RepID=UPI0038260E60
MLAASLRDQGEGVEVGTTSPAGAKAVDAPAADTGYDTALAGHGLPAGLEVFDQLRHCLVVADDLLGDDGEAYKQASTVRCPAFGGPFLIDIGNQCLFGTQNAESA